MVQPNTPKQRHENRRLVVAVSVAITGVGTTFGYYYQIYLFKPLYIGCISTLQPLVLLVCGSVV